MKFKRKNLQEDLFWLNFFEEVKFKNWSVKNSCKKFFKTWILNLQKYKKIKVRKFKDLFTKLDEVHFPIKVIECTGSFSIEVCFVDSKQEKYYLINDRSYSDIYVIGRRNSSLEPFVDRDFEFQILTDGGISFLRTGILELDSKENNKDVSVNFFYDTEKFITVVISKSYKYNRQIAITYPTIHDDFDKKVQRYLFEITETKCYYDDVFPILVWLCTQVSQENISISIVAKIQEEVFSQIDVENGIVKKHIYTQIIREKEERRFIVSPSKDLKTYLSENS